MSNSRRVRPGEGLAPTELTAGGLVYPLGTDDPRGAAAVTVVRIDDTARVAVVSYPDLAGEHRVAVEPVPVAASRPTSRGVTRRSRACGPTAHSPKPRAKKAPRPAAPVAAAPPAKRSKKAARPPV